MLDLFKERSTRPPGHRSALGLEKLEAREVPAVIGGMVYHDLNRNGLWNPSERGIANSTLQLRDQSGNLIATTTSDSTGRYQFTERNVGTNPPAEMTYEATFAEASSGQTRTSTLPKFDPSLGQLTSIEIRAEGALNNRTIVENIEATENQVKMELEGTMRFQVGGTTLQSQMERTMEATAGAFDGQADLQGTSAKDFGATQVQGQFTSANLTSASDLAAFTGTGTVNVSHMADADVCTCGPGNLLAMAQTKASGKVKVIYHYTPSNQLGPGTYTVVQTPQPGGFTDGFETRDNTTVIAGSNRTDTIQVTINSRTDQSTSNHFGEMTPPRPAPPTPTPPRPNINLGLTKYFFFGGMW